jgi:molybdopterin-guanine dinucleotide biosynthesis protein A
MSAPFAAVLLAAGRSTRMGRDKALLEIDGEPLWRRQRATLAALGPAELFLSVRPEQGWARGAKWDALLFDDLPNAGPMSGITAALERTTHGHAVVLAIDLPRMTPDWLRALAAGATPGVGVIGRREGFFEPLAAVYPRAMMSLFWEALVGARYALQPAIARGVAEGLMRVKDIAAAEVGLFENWNEPQSRAGL